SAFGGLAGLPQVYGDWFGIPDSNSLGNFLHGVVRHQPHEASHAAELGLAALATTAALVGTGLAWLLYVSRPALPVRIRRQLGALHRLVENEYYVDEIYDRLFVRPLVAISDRVLFRGIDAGLID